MNRRHFWACWPWPAWPALAPGGGSRSPEYSLRPRCLRRVRDGHQRRPVRGGRCCRRGRAAGLRRHRVSTPLAAEASAELGRGVGSRLRDPQLASGRKGLGSAEPAGPQSNGVGSGRLRRRRSGPGPPGGPGRRGSYLDRARDPEPDTPASGLTSWGRAGLTGTLRPTVVPRPGSLSTLRLPPASRARSAQALPFVAAGVGDPPAGWE